MGATQCVDASHECTNEDAVRELRGAPYARDSRREVMYVTKLSAISREIKINNNNKSSLRGLLRMRLR